MSHHYAHTGRGTTIMRRESVVNGTSYLSRVWYYRTRRGGRSTYFGLGRDWTNACTKADEIALFLSLPGASIVEARERFEWGRRPTSSKTATIGDVLDKLAEQAPALNLTPGSAYEYRTSLSRLVRIALGERLRREVTNDDVRAESCLILTPRLVSDYKLKAASGHDGYRSETSAKRTANSLLRNSKSVFSSAAREIYESHGLILPDLSAFLAAQPFRRVRVDYRLPDTAQMEKVLEFIASGPGEWDRNAWLGAHLASQAGLRFSEICHARWSWLRNDDCPHIGVQEEDDFRPKDSHGRKIPLSEEAYQSIMGHRIDCDTYIINGPKNERIEEWGRRASAVLRTHGLSASKPLHELRKWYGSAIACHYGLTKAQAWLGHTSPQLTHDYYADLDFPSSLLRFWKLIHKHALGDRAA